MFDIAVNVVGWKPHLETSPKSTYTPAWLQLAHKGGRMSSPEVRTLVWELICNLSNIFHHIEGRCLPLFKGLFFNATFFLTRYHFFLVQKRILIIPVIKYLWELQGFGRTWQEGAQRLPAFAWWFCRDGAQWILFWGTGMGRQIKSTWHHLTGIKVSYKRN